MSSKPDEQMTVVILPSDGAPKRLLECLVSIVDDPDHEEKILVIQQAPDVSDDAQEGYELAPLAAIGTTAARGALVKIATHVATKVIDGAATVIANDYHDNRATQLDYDRQAGDYMKGLHNYVYGG
jgi:hypothetical protein